MKTTLELSKALLTEAKARASREKTTLRALVEEGLRRVLGDAEHRRPFTLPDRSFRGKGLRPEFREAAWERIIAESYEGRGG